MGRKQKIQIINRRILHAKKRFLERKGIALDDYEYCSLIDQIVSQRSKFIARFNSNHTMHKVLYKSEWIPVVYSKRHKLIITAYQNNWIKKRNGKYFVITHKTYKYKKSKEKKVAWQLTGKWNKAKREGLGIS